MSFSDVFTRNWPLHKLTVLNAVSLCTGDSINVFCDTTTTEDEHLCVIQLPFAKNLLVVKDSGPTRSESERIIFTTKMSILSRQRILTQ